MDSFEDDEDMNAALSAAVGDHLHNQERRSDARDRRATFTIDTNNIQTNQQFYPKHLPISGLRSNKEYVQHDTRRVYKISSPSHNNDTDTTFDNFRYNNKPPTINQRHGRAVSYESQFQRESRMDFGEDYGGGRYISSLSPEKRKVLHSPPQYFLKTDQKLREWDLPKIHPTLHRRRRKHSANGKQVGRQENSFDHILQQHKKLQSELSNDYYKPNPSPLSSEELDKAPLTIQPQAGNEPIDKSTIVSQETVEIDGRHIPLADIKNALKKAFQHKFTDMVDRSTHQQPNSQNLKTNEKMEIKHEKLAECDNKQMQEEIAPIIPFLDKGRKVEYIAEEDQNKADSVDLQQVEDELDCDEDEELLQLRLLALSSAYSRNVIPPTQEKPTKKKNKRKKISKKVPQWKRKPQQKSNVVNDTKPNPVKNQKRNRRKPRLKKLSTPVLDPDLLTLGSVIRQMKNQQTNSEIKKGDVKDGNKSTNAGTSLDNYDIVEMDLDSPNNDGDSQIIQPTPPGTEVENVDKIHSQESIWELLDIPVPTNNNNNKESTDTIDKQEINNGKIQKIVPMPNPLLLQEKFNYSTPASPVDFQHAFVSSKAGSIGLDSELTCSARQHDLGDDIDELDQNESTSSAVADKVATTEEIELLRENLLKDISKKRTIDNSDVVTSSSSAIDNSITDKALLRKDFNYRFRTSKRKNVTKELPNIPASKIFKTRESGSDGLLPNPQSIFGTAPVPFPQFPPPMLPFVVPAPTFNPNCLPSTSNTVPVKLLNQTITKNSANDKFNSLSSTINKSSILSRLGPPVVTKQRLIHPPVVIDLVSCSSDEDDAFKMDLDKVIKNARAQVKANDALSKTVGNSQTSKKYPITSDSNSQNLITQNSRQNNPKISAENVVGDNSTKTSSSASGLVLGQSTVANTTTIKAVDGLQADSGKPSTRMVLSSTRTTTIQQPEKNTTTKPTITNQVTVKSTTVDQKPESTITKQEGQKTVTTVKKQAQKATEDVESVAVKLQRVRELLQRDKAVVSKFQQQQTAKQEEISKLDDEMKSLTTKLEKLRSQIQEENSNYAKIDKNLFEVTKKMKQRKKLEIRFLNQLNPKKDKLQDKSQNNETSQAGKVVVKSVNEEITNDDVFTDEQKNENEINLEKTSSPNKNLKTNARRIEEQKKILLEKQRNLERKKTLHEEKLKLKSTEHRLKLIKQRTESKILKHSKTQQILLTRKLYKNIHSTPTKLLHSYVSAQKLTPLQSNSRNYSATIRKHRNSLTRKNSSAGVRARTKSQEKRKRKLELENSKQQQHTLPNSTPTLRRRNRTNSISQMIRALRYNTNATKQNEETINVKPGFSLSNETALKLKRKLKKKFSHPHQPSHFHNYKSLFSNLHTVPECFSQWKVNVAELSRQSTFPAFRPDLNSFKSGFTYKSSLENFRSYRLSAYYRLKSKLSIPSSTYTNKINPNKLTCRYDLTGKCHDLNCQGQHLSEVSLSPNETYLDLLSYCPVLLKTENGEIVNKHDPLHVKLKAAEATVKRLCGSQMVNHKDLVTSFNETCVLLAGCVNRALGNTFPHTMVLSKRNFTILKPTNEQNNKIGSNEKVRIADWFNLESEEFILPEVTTRYFSEAQNSHDPYSSDINELKALLSKNPENVELRTRLANLYLSTAASSGNKEKKNCLDLALNTLCLGIEIDEQNEILWSNYLPLLRLHNRNDNIENLEVVDQCLVLLPYSKPIWTEILKWKWPYQKLQSLYHQLIQSLVMRRQIWATDDELKVWEEKHDFKYYSSWLLHMIVEQCYFTLVCKGKNEARKILLGHVKYLDGIRKTQQEILTATKTVTEYPITQEHLCKVWLVYIHLIEHDELPDAVFDHSLSAQEYGIAIGNKEIRLNFSTKFNQKPEKLQSLLKAALLSCNDLSLPIEDNTMSCLPLYQALIDVETASKNWDAVNSTCQRLISSGCCSEDSKQASRLWVMWLHSILMSNDSVMITQMFDKAVTACPKCAKLSYMAAMYQLNSSNTDEEAALLYLETCISAFIDLGEKESLTVVELHYLYRKLLKHEVGLPFSDKEEIKIREKVFEENFNEEKTYLWLLYCILNELLIKGRKDGQEGCGRDEISATSSLFETALLNTPAVEERKIIWTEYILYERSLASNIKHATQSALLSTQSGDYQLAQLHMLWMKKFTSLIKRCLNSVPSKFVEDKLSFIDYTFHNQIASIYLECFHGSHYCTALVMLTEFMPNNIPLLYRASSRLLKEGNSGIVTSLLWGVTSQSRLICRRPSLWRIMAAAYVAEEKYWKALAVYKDSLSALSKHRAVWKEIVSLALLCGDNVDLEGVNPKFSNIFGETLRSMSDDVIQSIK